MSLVERRLAFQRDFYQLLLELHGSRSVDLRETLKQALSLIVDITHAQLGYIEVQRKNGEIVYSTHSLGETEVEDVQHRISSGIIATALASGEAVKTSTALLDPRFNSRQSVQNAKIETVFCAPIIGAETRGVIYLEGDRLGDNIPVDLDATSYTRHISPFLDQLLTETELGEGRPLLKTLRAKYMLDEIVGNSKALYEVLRSSMMVAPLAVNVLLTGSSGTGKNQLARAIHANSGRQGRPFVEVNCAALQETLIENELFGDVKGAHSGASTNVEGKVGAADGGTLFLDEIGSLSFSVQAKLLQFLQSGEYYPLGASSIRHSDARVIFASNSDLGEAVEAGTFRSDLFYRINAFPIEMPNLSLRTDDIGELSDVFCTRACSRHHFPLMTITAAGKRYLRQLEWPGNVRELRHHVESACIRAAFDGRYVIGPDELRRQAPTSRLYPLANDDGSLQGATQAFQASLVSDVLRECDGNVSAAARQLKISRTHLYNLIKNLDIHY